nr:MAG TPA: hypothetical protein [Caudoviricetes sp.]
MIAATIDFFILLPLCFVYLHHRSSFNLRQGFCDKMTHRIGRWRAR